MQRDFAPSKAGAKGSAVSRRQLFGGAAVVPKDIGPRVAVVGQSCLSLLGTSCRICAEHCELTAIRFRPALGGRAEISISDTCSGCGNCTSVCPAGAISLQAIAIPGGDACA